MITDRFSADDPLSMAQGRHGEMIIVQGHGVRPARWDGRGAAIDAGMDAPESAPSVTADSTVHYYVARVDVQKPGAVYYAPPAVSFSVPSDAAPDRFRSAAAAAYLSQAAVGEVLVKDGGKYYSTPPSASLSDTHGKGAVLEAVLDIPDTGGEPPDNTQLRYWSVIEGPPYEDEVDFPPIYKTYFNTWGWVDLPIDADGEYEYTDKRYAICPDNPNSFSIINVKIPYSVSGSTGTGAKLRVRFAGNAITCECQQVGPGQTLCIQTLVGAWRIDSVSSAKRGTGYKKKVTVTIQAAQSWDVESQKWVTAGRDRDAVIEGESNTSSTAAPRYSVKEIKIVDPGSGYLVVPQLKITSDSGFGAYATCTVKDGKIEKVTLENGGGGYKDAPKVEVIAGGAEVFAVARPHLRGKYQCYYRYVDNTPDNKGGPIPSSLSPVKEVDAFDGSTRLVWDVPAPNGRASKLELWRSTGNQATTLYRVAVLDVAAGSTDTGSDNNPLPGANGGDPNCPPDNQKFRWMWMLPECDGTRPPAPATTITITRQPTAKRVWADNWLFSAQPYYEVSLAATGPGTLSYQWQGRYLTLLNGTVLASNWVTLPNGYAPDCTVPPCENAYATNGDNFLRVYPDTARGGKNTLFKEHRCIVTSSEQGVASVTSATITATAITQAS